MYGRTPGGSALRCLSSLAAALLLCGAVIGCDATADATFRFADNVSVTGPMVHGRISKAHVAAEVWNDLMAGFRSNETVEVTVGTRTENVTLGEPMPFTCT